MKAGYIPSATGKKNPSVLIAMKTAGGKTAGHISLLLIDR
jgi:hypothetical protein